LDEEAERIPPGSDGLILLPYFLGQRSPQFDPLARGVLFGLTMSHTREHIYRALLESFGYGCLHGLDANIPDWESCVNRVIATGGGARSRIWRQIVSDIVGVPQEYPAKGDSPLGGAYFAGYGVGIFNDFETIRDEWLEVTSVTEPDQGRRSTYLGLYKVYRDLHDDLRHRFTVLTDAV
jgi:xylulokinase